MKKWIALSVITVFGFYGLGLHKGWDMFIPLWILLAASGLVFWVSDGMVIRASNPRHQSFLDINQSELDYAESTRRKAAQDKSPATTLIVSVAIAAAVCLVHCYVFPVSSKKDITHDEQYGIEAVYQKIGEPQSSIRINMDTNQTGIITSLRISYQSKLSSNKACRELVGNYSDDMKYDDVLPVTYFYQERDGNGYLEWIVLNLYQDEFDIKESEELLKYLGLVSEMEDGILTLNELKDSETFKFKQILIEGEYSYNISFAGEEKYTVKEAQKGSPTNNVDTQIVGN